MSAGHTIPEAVKDVHQKVILVVEDDEAIGQVIVETIEQETGYKTCLVTNGSDALKVVDSIQPNLFLLDYQLPGVTGIQVYDQLHSITSFKGTPAILMSANIPKYEVEKRRIGSLRKPFDLDELIRTIEQNLG